MPLPIRDGNQSLTTLSTILVSNTHIPAHTVVSLGTQAITDIATAVSGVELGPNTLNALENITVTLGQVTITGGLTDAQLRASAVTIGGSVTATISGTPSVTFTQASVTFGTAVITGSASIIGTPSVTFTQIATHGVIIGTGTAQIGSVTASISGTPSITFGLISGTITVGSLPAIPDGTNQIGSVTASGTVTANIGGIANSVTLPVRLNAEKYGEAPSGQDTLLVCNASGMLLVDAIANNTSVLGYDGNAFVQVKQVSGSSVTVGNTVTIGTLPSGALTTRFGSITTAGTAQITNAVTNTSRKYLLAQNISSSAVTIGIGFSPTTTQGIQLNAGAGLTFDAFCPTGAVYWLGSVTGASFTILEG
jgi:hypothetical protein